MVAKRSDEERRHWTNVGPEAKNMPLPLMMETLSETAPQFIKEIAACDERAVRSARNIIRSLADTLHPSQLAHLFHMMMKNAVTNYPNKQE